MPFCTQSLSRLLLTQAALFLLPPIPSLLASLLLSWFKQAPGEAAEPLDQFTSIIKPHPSTRGINSKRLQCELRSDRHEEAILKKPV